MKRREKHCHYLSPALLCNAGGFGHLGCMDHKFHECCPYKIKMDELEKTRNIRLGIKKLFG